MIFKKKYRQLGLITLPYLLIFEFISPLIELIGVITFAYLAMTGGVNWDTAWIIFLVMYVFCIQLSFVVVYYDYLQTKMAGFSYIRLVVAALLEPFIYHPMIIIFSLRGYLRFIMKQRIAWGEMKRKGFQNKQENTHKDTTESNQHAENSTDNTQEKPLLNDNNGSSNTNKDISFDL